MSSNTLLCSVPRGTAGQVFLFLTGVGDGEGTSSSQPLPQHLSYPGDFFFFLFFMQSRQSYETGWWGPYGQAEGANPRAWATKGQLAAPAHSHPLPTG